MAVELNISYCTQEACKTLLLTDTTGDYALDNLGGWGTPNEDKALVDNASVAFTITIPNGTSYTVWAQADLGVDYTTDLLEFPISTTHIGLTTDDIFPEGIYEVEMYLVYDPLSTAVEMTVARRFYVLCEMQYNIDSLLVEYVQSNLCDTVDYKKIENIYQVFLLYRALQESVSCGQADQADALYCRINKMLKLL